MKQLWYMIKNISRQIFIYVMFIELTHSLPQEFIFYSLIIVKEKNVIKCGIYQLLSNTDSEKIDI